MSIVYGSSTTIYGGLLIAYIPPFPSLASPLLPPFPPGSITTITPSTTVMAATCIASCTTALSLPYHRYGCYLYCLVLTTLGLVIDDDLGVVFIQRPYLPFRIEKHEHINPDSDSSTIGWWRSTRIRSRICDKKDYEISVYNSRPIRTSIRIPRIPKNNICELDRGRKSGSDLDDSYNP